MLTEIFGSGFGPRHSWESCLCFRESVTSIKETWRLRVTQQLEDGVWRPLHHIRGVEAGRRLRWAGLGVVAPPCGQAFFHSRAASELRDQSGTCHITIYDLFLKATQHGSAIVCWLQQIIRLSRSKEREIKSHFLMEEKQSVGDGRYCCNHL